MGWITKLIVLGVVGYGGYEAYLMHDAGYFDLPEVPDGAYVISFKSGLRGIVLDAEVDRDFDTGPAFFRQLSYANPRRRYIGIPFDVASWFKDTWSTCQKPTDEARDYFLQTMPDDMKQKLTGARFDAVCYIETDDKNALPRGLIYSVPKM